MCSQQTGCVKTWAYYVNNILRLVYYITALLVKTVDHLFMHGH